MDHVNNFCKNKISDRSCLPKIKLHILVKHIH